jgi:hemoglobin
MTDDPSTVWATLGGHAGLHRLVERFYDVMDTAPDAAAIRAMHPKSLAGSRQRLFGFLAFRLGGDPAYVEARGHPRLRMRHMPFEIGAAEARAWIDCMEVALEETVADAHTRDVLRAFFTQVAHHMRNQAD